MKAAKKKTLGNVSRRTGPLDRYIGAQIRAARNARGLSQSDLGAKLGLTFQQIQKYEKATNRVSAAHLFEICEVLGLSLASMFERKLKEDE